MFRPMRRIKQQVSDDECKRVLNDEKRASFSVIDETGYPYTVPVNFFYDEEENKTYIHCAKEGHKVDALRRCDKVCFTVWNQGFRIISGNPRQFNYRDESAGLCVSAQKYNNRNLFLISPDSCICFWKKAGQICVEIQEHFVL